MSNKDSELGKLLWKDLGLDYQIGMDVASGYSNAEVNNLASLRGFAGRLAGKSMYLFRQSDAFARGVTLLTAYNKALDEGKSKAEAIEYAKEINDKVNFDYSVADEPTIFRALGPISKAFLQFKKYPVKQLELFQDFYLDGRELGLNRKQSFLRMVKYVAPYMAMSGMMGIPFVSLAGGLLSYFAGIATGDDDWDWEKKIKQLMITEFGEDRPDIQRCGKAENKAGKEDTRRRKLKLSMLSVVKVSSAYLYKEQNCEYHIAHGKNHIINDSLNLSLGSVPSAFDCACHISGRKCGHGESRHKDGHEQKREKDSHGFLFHRVLPPNTF